MTIATFDARILSAAPDKTDVPLWRLYILRATYLLLVVAMGGQVWPALFHHHPWTLMQGVANCMLAAMTALAALGLRYPLKMLPILFFELIWKTTWLIAIATPAWAANAIDPAMADTIFACALGAIFPIAIPWRHVFDTYLAAPGDRWR
jgi:hypothetical protein